MPVAALSLALQMPGICLASPSTAPIANMCVDAREETAAFVCLVSMVAEVVSANANAAHMPHRLFRFQVSYRFNLFLIITHHYIYVAKSLVRVAQLNIPQLQDRTVIPKIPNNNT